MRVSLLVLLLSLTACQSSKASRSPSPVKNPDVGPTFDEDVVPNPNPKPAETSQPPKPDTPAVTPEPTDSDLPEAEPLAVVGDQALTGNPNLPFGRPKLTKGQKAILISRAQYVLSWNPDTRAVNWAAWVIQPSDLGTQSRSGFLVDEELKAAGGRAVASNEYSRTCFDRGHMVAAADRKAKEADARAVAYMSNIIPQTAFQNQVVWVQLEDQVRDWIVEGTYPRLWIVTGPVYERDDALLSEASGIHVGQKTFKAIYTWDNAGQPQLLKSILMPNLTSKGTDPVTDRETACSEQSKGGRSRGEEQLPDTWESYLVEPAAIEAAAGLKLLP